MNILVPDIVNATTITMRSDSSVTRFNSIEYKRDSSLINLNTKQQRHHYRSTVSELGSIPSNCGYMKHTMVTINPQTES